MGPPSIDYSITLFGGEGNETHGPLSWPRRGYEILLPCVHRNGMVYVGFGVSRTAPPQPGQAEAVCYQA